MAVFWRVRTFPALQVWPVPSGTAPPRVPGASVIETPWKGEGPGHPSLLSDLQGKSFQTSWPDKPESKHPLAERRTCPAGLPWAPRVRPGLGEAPSPEDGASPTCSKLRTVSRRPRMVTRLESSIGRSSGPLSASRVQPSRPLLTPASPRSREMLLPLRSSRPWSLIIWEGRALSGGRAAGIGKRAKPEPSTDPTLSPGVLTQDTGTPQTWGSSRLSVSRILNLLKTTSKKSHERIKLPHMALLWTGILYFLNIRHQKW